MRNTKKRKCGTVFHSKLVLMLPMLLVIVFINKVIVPYTRKLSNQCSVIYVVWSQSLNKIHVVISVN